MTEPKPPRPSSQQPFRPPTSEELERSPNWQRIKQTYAAVERLRERSLLPEFTPQQIERIRRAQPGDDSISAKLTRQVHEQLRKRREQAEEAERPNAGKLGAVEAPDSMKVESTAPVTATEAPDSVAPQRKVRSPHKPPKGRPRAEIPYFDNAMAELVQQYPRVRDQTRECHMAFLTRYIRDRGRKIDDIRFSDGRANKAQKQLLRSHIKNWLERHPPT